MSKNIVFGRANKRLLLVAVVALVLLLAAWGQFVYTSPEKVFWGMLDESLATTGVERTISQKNNSGTLKQTGLLRFGSTNATRSLATLNQKGEFGETTISTESIGTPGAEYSRYLGIKTDQKNMLGKPLDFGQIIGVWGKNDQSEGQTPQFMSQTAFGLIPFANLRSEQRKQIIGTMRDKKVYTVDFKLVKSKKENGRQNYLYSVKLNPSAYIEMLQKLTKLTGLPPIEGLVPSAYTQSQPIRLTIVVAKQSRQLTRIEYDGTNQEESYSGYGLMTTITPPQKTIPLSHLQEQVQGIH